ncbi:MAG: ABC transporter substrate-binding protein [Spirochaetota bacterium]|nr:ABC transporter substrate-binding protein [Spirochaetota bacterium]
MFSLVRFISVVVSVLFSLTLFSGCGPKEKKAEIKVGLLGAMTGRLAVYGTALHGAELAFNEINENGGIESMNGAKIEWVYADTASSANKVVSELERLVENEKVDAIIFSSPTSEVMAGASLYDKLKVPVISTIATSEPLFNYNLKYWRMISIPSSSYGTFVIEWLTLLLKEFKVKIDKIAIATAEAPHLLAYLKHEKKELKRLGLDKNIILDITYNAKSELPTMSSTLLKIKASKPDILIVNDYNSTLPHYWRAAHNIGLKIPFTIYVLTTLGYPKAWSVLGNDLMMKHVVSKPVLIPVVMHKDASHEAFQRIQKKMIPWVEEKGLKMTDYYYINAQAAYAFQKAWELTGNKDPKAVNDTLNKLEIKDGDPAFILPLFSPALKWYPNGKIVHAKLPSAQWHGTLEDHSIELIFPKKLRTAKPILKW